MKITFAPMGLLCFALVFAISAIAQDSKSAITPTNHIGLFNGKDFTGWTFCMRTNADPSQTWIVTNGVIHCTGKPIGYLRTKQDYQRLPAHG